MSIAHSLKAREDTSTYQKPLIERLDLRDGRKNLAFRQFANVGAVPRNSSSQGPDGTAFCGGSSKKSGECQMTEFRKLFNVTDQTLQYGAKRQITVEVSWKSVW